MVGEVGLTKISREWSYSSSNSSSTFGLTACFGWLTRKIGASHFVRGFDNTRSKERDT